MTPKQHFRHAYQSCREMNMGIVRSYSIAKKIEKIAIEHSRTLLM